MRLLPRHRVLRIAAALWLLTCVVFLLLMLPHADERGALARMVPVYFFSFPSGHIAVVALSKIKLALYLDSGYQPRIITECLFLWATMVTLGYLQWFVALPWISRACWWLCVTRFGRGGESNRKHQ